MDVKAMVVAINDHESGKYLEKNLSIRGLFFSAKILDVACVGRNNRFIRVMIFFFESRTVLRTYEHAIG
jgi:hypothetical protein